MQKDPQPIRICVVCKKLIEPDRVAIQTAKGENIHSECWNEFNETRREKGND